MKDHRLAKAPTNYYHSVILPTCDAHVRIYADVDALSGMRGRARARPPAGANKCGCTFLTAREFATGRLKSANERIRITELLPTWTIVCALIGIHGVAWPRVLSMAQYAMLL